MQISSIVQAWFERACQHLQGVVQGCVVLGEPDSGEYTQVLVSTEQFTNRELVQENINAVIMRRRSVVSRIRTGDTDLQLERYAGSNVQPVSSQKERRNFLVSCPLILGKQLYGAVSFEFADEPSSQSQDFLNSVESAVKWLEFACQSQAMQTGNENSSLALRIVALSMSHETSSTAATAVMTELANILSCERVSLGFVDNHEMNIFALSHSAVYEAKQNLLKDIRLTMREAMEQHETLVYPADGDNHFLLQAHRDLSSKHGCANICTVPLVVQDDVVGGIVFERSSSDSKFSLETVELCEQLAALFTPVLEYRRHLDRPVLLKVKDYVRSSFKNITGSEHMGVKLGSMLAIMLCVLMVFVQWDYKVSANAVLEGRIERVITAPESGYIKQATARPGDVVEANQVLATLDDKDLKLEKLKWSGKRKEVSKEYREALASHDRSRIGIIRAQIEQAEAQLSILDKKLDRALISAPLDGVIVSGDYTRALGAPVEKGQILYKVSPLDQYRIILEVDETDIAELSVGMKGELTLSAAAEDVFEIVIERITPVSVAADGINYFQVEASLVTTPKFLRPGMQGVGKIDVGERQLIWIWTHKMIDWLRLWLWAWL